MTDRKTGAPRTPRSASPGGVAAPASRAARNGDAPRKPARPAAPRGAGSPVRATAQPSKPSPRPSSPRHGLPQDSLAYALDAGATVVGAVRAGAALPAALAAIFASREQDTSAHDAGAERAIRSDWHGATQDIAYRTLRELALVDAVIGMLVPKAPAPRVRDLLACALTLLNATDTPYTSHTVVDQAVRAAAAAPETAFARGLVNAVLRNFLREQSALLERARRDPVARWNYPRWWIDAVRQAWGEQSDGVLAAGNVQAPMTLRVNRRHATPQAYLATLHEAGIAAELALPCGVRLAKAMAVERLPGFADGVVSVQDAGAQRAALLLDVADGMRVLDACAAPGGKTGHLLELADIRLVALESDAPRARRIGDNLRRLRLEADVVVGDAGHPAAPWWDDKPFDRVLADVPCSASGIVRRHPDIRWLRRPDDLRALVQQQRRILDALWQVVAPGGILLYVTCSIFPEESEEQAAWFEQGRPDAVRLTAPGQLMPTVAGEGSGPDHDGFFYARFQKR
ncbi:16S rRNA (cytosine(967)-C(5))-methyltransferase RsmB [Robbsia sp. Bb-Pol-6]|uniref:16S rRNA (cytosine(967)-C(5))-methyltransferase n=1 Tax=Robbsia betulipollinis TaxID=2981849 RepID=A0ABT3ZKC4_9BURK|nr:16S rRNA (cytosine(967)-C(5))-methyltransferase RsmB [Robbsia betulipollinis]MCY0386872.1 16S rRNA (cytosine(967)-C(5))-methyltransferase RsmB [Robbsia betulipollinis]